MLFKAFENCFFNSRIIEACAIPVYVKFNEHFTHAKQVTVLKVADKRVDGPDDDNRHLTQFWPRPKKDFTHNSDACGPRSER